MSMTMEELMEAMKSAGTDGGSALNMRSEDLQTKQRVGRIPMLKNALKKKSKLLLETEIALPFNPETGEADDTFNEHRKYRPQFSATTTALALKDAANKNEKLKEVLMKRAGVTEWDTSSSEFTKDDWAVFDRYRVPRIFSLTVTHIDIQEMGTGAFGRDYNVRVERDENGEIVGEEPSFITANSFFRSIVYEKVKEYEESIKSGECKDDEKAQKKFKSDLYASVPVSDDKPANFVRLFEIPVDNSYELRSEPLSEGLTAENIKEYEVLSRYKKGIRQAIESYLDKGWKRYDTCFDFFDVEMTCPTDGDESSNKGKADIGLNTKFEKPSVTLTNSEVYGANGEKTAVLRKALREYVDRDLNVEQRVRVSMRIPVFDEDAEYKMMRCLASVIDIDNDKYITKNVITAHKDFIRSVFGDRGDEIVEEVEAGVSDLADGSADPESVAKEAASYDLTSDEFNDAAAEVNSGDDDDEGKLEELDLTAQSAV